MRHSILFVLLILLFGCVATYRDFPAATPLPSATEPAAPPRCRQAVQFDRNVDPWSRKTVRETLDEALTSYGGCSSSLLQVYQSKVAETTVMVSVLRKPRVWPGEPEQMLSESLYYFIPIYSGDSGFTLTYSFYARNALRKTYTYEITEKRASWFLLLPFVWLNCFTYSLDDAVRATAAQFVTDAHRDGYL